MRWCRATGQARLLDTFATFFRSPRIPPERMGRRRVRLGTLSTGEPLDLAIRGRNFLVGGDPKSGKSWMAGSLCEQLILQRYSLCILDPEGDYACLEALPGVIVQPVDGKEASFLGLERVLDAPGLEPGGGHVDRSQEDKPLLVRRLLEAINRLRRATGLPHRVVVDEAHYFLNRLDDPGALRSRAGRLPSRHVSDLRSLTGHPESERSGDRHARRRSAAGPCAARPGARVGTPSEWLALLADLAIDEAVLLPGAL